MTRWWGAWGTARQRGVAIGVTAISAHFLQFLPDPADRLAFVALQYDLDNTLYGGSPPHVGSVSLARWLVPSEALVAAPGWVSRPDRPAVCVRLYSRLGPVG
jgi:hypothetical protein